MQPSPRTLLPLLLCALLGCEAFDDGLLEARDGRRDAGPPGPGMDGGARDGGGDGDADGGSACTDGVELCNGEDDDCDDAVDEDTLAECQGEILNAETGCFAIPDGARCVLLRCDPGFANCDGDPTNGCEPYCACNPCDDAGADEDGGALQ